MSVRVRVSVRVGVGTHEVGRVVVFLARVSQFSEIVHHVTGLTIISDFTLRQQQHPIK